MVQHFASPDLLLDDVYGALAAPARRQMLASLREGEQTAGDLWKGLQSRGIGISKPAVTKHLRVLEASALVDRRVDKGRDGRKHLIRLRAEPLAPAADWILSYQAFWERRLDALARLLEGDGPRVLKDDKR
ncbi:MAG: helix-turn-helix domain-containing protein [Planctomycetota bacterium]